ncbi:50S ribosomal protein L13 [Candidatus Woesearchaeota archaeon]|jgi:large subunit ribosomal protein L13|nr:50S ribosomal protein L13 [Candidatus Woesearchaeota archaeon]MBT5740270.1 50S ribosomal protein L13 [Candidatus Woesearchaeota archaeon]
MKVYNGENMLLGRLATRVAKSALLGEEVKVVNCEKIMVSGRKTNTFAHHKQRYDRRGYPLKSANHSRLPERFVRRAIRGMLPWKQTRGKEAYKRIMCYKGIPGALENEKLITLEDATFKKLPTLKYTTVGSVCKHLGGKTNE